MKKTSAQRDMAGVVLVSLLAAVVCVRFDVSEAIAGWTRPREGWQLDELPGVLLVVAICLLWFSLRRYFEAKRELALRNAAEKRLAEALAENQRLALKYVDMQESERKALARDLHDELRAVVRPSQAQTFTGRNHGRRSAFANDALFPKADFDRAVNRYLDQIEVLERTGPDVDRRTDAHQVD